jgi:DNA polymerase III epsilon subunit-like protein
LVTHHGEFEKSFLLNELLLCDVQFKPKFICTRQICKDLYPYILGTTADKIIQQLGIQSMHDEASPSFVDVYRTYAIFQRIMSDLMSLGQANTYDYYI